jgi:hypothetical protein
MQKVLPMQEVPDSEGVSRQEPSPGARRAPLGDNARAQARPAPSALTRSLSVADAAERVLIEPFSSATARTFRGNGRPPKGKRLGSKRSIGIRVPFCLHRVSAQPALVCEHGTSACEPDPACVMRLIQLLLVARREMRHADVFNSSRSRLAVEA